jgi:hypothetical protein
MILIDTDILSAMAKIARLPLLFTLLQTTRLHITPGVFGELTHSFNLKRPYATDVFALIAADSLMASATAEVPYAVYVHEAIKNSLDFEALKCYSNH